MPKSRRESSYSVNTSSKNQKHDFDNLGKQDKGETSISTIEQEDTL